MSSWPLIQSRWIEEILFHDEKFKEVLKKTFKFYLMQVTLLTEHMAFVRKEDCPSLLDNISQDLETMFWGEYTMWLVALVELFFQENKLFYEKFIQSCII